MSGVTESQVQSNLEKMAQTTLGNPVKTPMRVTATGGMLRSGNPGNAGGGRKPDELRRLARTDFESWLAVLRTKAALALDDNYPDVSIRDVIGAIDALGKYGLGEKTWSLDESQQVQAIGQATASFFQAMGRPELFDVWIKHVEEHVKAL